MNHEFSSSSNFYPPPPQQPQPYTHVTNPYSQPDVPPSSSTYHPNNQNAPTASWGGVTGQPKDHPPYNIQGAPVDKNNAAATTPLDSVLKKCKSWTAKAESTANNLWHNLKTGPSVPDTAWGKVNLRAKTITGGGFEALYRETFGIYPNEVLKKTFACYLSTSTGPIPGTLYLSNVHIGFCSDRPLSYTAPSGQQIWSCYKILIPLATIGSINPVIMKESSKERYLQLMSRDGHDYWFMGFVNFEKACRHLNDSLSSSAAAGIPVPQPLGAEQHHQRFSFS